MAFTVTFDFCRKNINTILCKKSHFKTQPKGFLIIKMSTRKKKLSSMKNLAKANAVKKQLLTHVGRKKKS